MLPFIIGFVVMTIIYRIALEQGVKIGENKATMSIYIKYMMNKPGFEKDIEEFYRKLKEQ